jgi:GTP-binding protein
MFETQDFVQSVYNINELPKLRLPEAILCGRSNVGKSSFINSLFNKKKLAKISSTPGKTRSINYYKIDEKFYIVDLPGYGYAKISKTERERWGKLVEDFISSSGHISLAFHIIDSRHKPTILDEQLNSLLKSYKLPYVVILSKIDKLNQSEIASSKKVVKEIFPDLGNGKNLFGYSAIKKTGQKDVLKKLIEQFY